MILRDLVEFGSQNTRTGGILAGMGWGVTGRMVIAVALFGACACTNTDSGGVDAGRNTPDARSGTGGAHTSSTGGAAAHVANTGGTQPTGGVKAAGGQAGSGGLS